jgi:Glyoxalase-like domain
MLAIMAQGRAASTINQFDHLFWAVPELEAGRAELERLTGVMPAIGGRHPGVGTHNALADLGGDRRFLEVIAPDPGQDRFSSFGNLVKGIKRPTLLTWVVRTTNAQEIAEIAKAAGLLPGVVLALSRRRPDGTSVSWRTVQVFGHTFGALVPFFIEWRGNEHHPSAGATRGLELRELKINTPRPEELVEIFEALHLASIFPRQSVSKAPESGLIATLETPKGRVTLS